MDIESFLAQLYVDPTLRARFLADPRGEARGAGFDDATAERLAHIDVTGLQLAAASFAKKREHQHKRH